MRNFLTNRHKNYWKNRKINWKQAYWADHPHRELIIKVLKNIKFGSIIEIGCGAGYNLHKIRENFKFVEIGGVDISPDAIETAEKLLPEDTAVLEVTSGDKLFLSDQSSDVVLSDMCLIYADPFKINDFIREMRRVSRKYVLLIEFHHKNWIKRLLLRLFSGYNSYNYEKLLKKHGFQDIEMLKLKEKDWPGGQPQKEFAWLIIAKR